MKKIINPQGVDITYLDYGGTHMFNTAISKHTVTHLDRNKRSVRVEDTPLGQRDKIRK